MIKCKMCKYEDVTDLNFEFDAEICNDCIPKRISDLEDSLKENIEGFDFIEKQIKHQEKLKIEAENDKIKVGNMYLKLKEKLIVWNRIGRDITQSCEGHEEHDVKSLLNQIKDVSDDDLFETKLEIEIERDKYYELYVNACKNIEEN